MEKVADVLTERVIIEGVNGSGASFEFQEVIDIKLNEQTPEQALLEALGSDAETFEEYVLTQKWLKAQWSYPSLQADTELFVVK